MFDMDKSGASRILRTLAESGFAAKGSDRRYRAGAKLTLQRGNAAILTSTYSVKELARPLLEQLHGITSETVTLGLRADDQVLYLDMVATDLPLRVERPIGTLAPLHRTALGKALLAFSGGPIPRTFFTFTGNTNTEIEDLQAQLRRIVELGYSWDDEEFVRGVRCVAAPLRDPATRTVVAIIGISGPSARISVEHLNVLGELAKRVAANFGK